MTLYVLVFFFFFLSLDSFASSAVDTIKYGQTLLINQTLVSNGSIFELGFFNPSKFQTKYYLGIWYNNIPSSPVVWVANRESPLTDVSGYLAFTSAGNVGVFSKNGSIIWSSNATQDSNGTEAILLDSGNFVLSLDGNNIWEGFNNPTDTFLPEMKIRSYYKLGIATRIICWAAADDPSPGEFSIGFDSSSSLQIKAWKDSKTYWRSPVVIGAGVGATLLHSSFYVEQLVSDDTQMYYSYSVTANLGLTRFIIERTGSINMLTWNQTSNRWDLQISLSNITKRACKVYNQCGPNGVCSNEYTTPLCKCLLGFKPKNSTEWNARNFSSGCMKDVVWDCGKEGYFLPYTNMKYPDNLVRIRDVDEAGCKANCTASCNCTAYLFDDVQTLDSRTTCLVWYGDLIDLMQNLTGTSQLNVRVSAFDIINSHSFYKKPNHLVAIILPVLLALILIMAAIGYFKSVQRKKKGMAKRLNGTNNYGGETSKGLADVPYIDFSHILAATDKFSLSKKIGEGGFGPVYRGELQNGQEVAIKRLSRASRQGFEEFKNEIELIAKLQHTNLVKLIGWCSEKGEKLLIYEYLQKGSLDRYLFGKDQPTNLAWEKRWQIIEGIAQGILYLHRYSRLHIIHRDLKTSNILLDDKMSPKISDFGLARIVDGNQVEVNTGRIAGTYGYMSPEYALQGTFSDKSDVFSFGVILLEILSGKRNTDSYLYNDSLNLLGYVWQLWIEKRCCEVADPSLGNSLPVPQLLRCIQVGLLCVQERPAERPTMSSVVYMLSNSNIVLPTPGKPAFTIGNEVRPAATSSSSCFNDSKAQITITEVEAR